MPDQGRRTYAFTLVELLTALAVVAILFVAIVGLSTGFLRYSGRVSVTNDRLADLNDALGYMATKGRGALAVLGGSASPTISYGGNSFTCSDGSTDGPCIGFVVPVVDRSSATSEVTGYELVAYRVIGIEDWDENPGVADGWDGGDTPMILEYRAPVGSPAPPTNVNATRASLIVSDLATAGFAPFEVTSSDRVVMRLRSGGRTADEPTVPHDAPLMVMVTPRP